VRPDDRLRDTTQTEREKPLNNIRRPQVRDHQWYIEEIIFSLKHYWRFVDCEALELKALSQGANEKAA
jgi:hypothetical protein